jgi:hypothetical protein
LVKREQRRPAWSYSGDPGFRRDDGIGRSFMVRTFAAMGRIERAPLALVTIRNFAAMGESEGQCASSKGVNSQKPIDI